MRALRSRFVVGPLAVLAIVAILVAGPVLLVSLAGNPLPGHLPSTDQVAQWLRQHDGTLLPRALAIAGWVAWAVIAGSVLLELGAQLAGRCAPGLLGGPQRLANLLVAAALAILSTPGVSHANAAYLDAAYLDPARPAVESTPPGPAPTAGPVHRVDHGDWMWHIAGRYLGDELRYPEIAALNPHLAQRHAAFPDHIEPGDELRLPPDANDRGERPHATGPLVDGSAHPRSGTAEHPPDAEGVGPPPAAPTEDPGRPAGDEGAAGDGHAGGERGPHPDAAGPTEQAPAQGGPATTRDGPETARVDEDDPDTATAVDRALVAPASAAMLASALVGAVAWHRARRRAHRRHRRHVTDGSTAAAEAGVRAAATVEVTHLDRALRSLSVACASTGFPDVGAVWVAGDDLHFILAATGNEPPPPPPPPSPPPPFRRDDAGGWWLPSGAELPAGAGAVAPLPALVTLGSQPGRHLLVDLERLGVLTLTGDPRACADLLRHIAAELAHNPWSDQVDVTLAGFPPEQAELLVSLNPGRLRHAPSLPAAVADIRRRLHVTTSALTTHALVDSVHGRVSDTATDTWAPHVLLVYGSGAEPDRTLTGFGAELSRAGRRCAVAVVATGHAAGTAGERRVTVTGDGLLGVSFVAGSGGMPAAALPEHLLQPYADLVREARTPGDHPIPPAGELWAAGADAAGVPTGSDAAGGHPPGTGPPALTADTPTMPLPTITRVATDDADLDRAVAAWPRHPGPTVAVLGPVRVAAPGPPPPQRPAVCQELVVFLAARGGAGATAGEIVHHLWPRRPRSAAARNQVIIDTRRWLGVTTDGRDWLPEADADGRYRLRDGLLVDWHLFRRLRARGLHHARAEDLRAALRLVRGEPAQRDPDLAGAATRIPYAWLVGTPFAPDLIRAGVVDTAHELVDQSLAAGDLSTGRWAVGQAWLADPGREDDHPWRDLLRLAHAGGDVHELRGVIAEMLRWRDTDHPDELSPATRELIVSLLRGRPPDDAGTTCASLATN